MTEQRNVNRETPDQWVTSSGTNNNRRMGKRLPIRRDHGASCPKTEFSDHEMATVKASAWSHTFETRAVTPIRVLGGSRHLSEGKCSPIFSWYFRLK